MTFRPTAVGFSFFFDKVEMNGEHKVVETFIERHYIDKGINIGIERGLNNGRAEGRAEGHAEAYSDVARNMLRMNFPTEQIAKITGLSPEAITKIEKCSPRT